ncbi:MAG: C2H2-type zinc finger protein [Candidatus Parvarchaeota archaeon]|jgi:hypothetical protein|nr:C2H2-type zinc finger protein [Candidatus Parvarchaeota archaeon]MCL5420345.1 C2H2-type zinc finger protein [Candidatus Parvarchaeota archaeon]
MELFHKKFKCEKCGEHFKTQEELDEHMKVHMQPQEPQQSAPGSNEQPAQETVPEQTVAPQNDSDVTANDQGTQEQQGQDNNQ